MLPDRAQTLRWTGDALDLLDQRKLPTVVAFVRCSRADDVARAIRSLVVRGAPAIGCAAAYGIALEALHAMHRGGGPGDVDSAFERLAASRPTAVNLFWALARMRSRWKDLHGATPGERSAAMLAEAHAIRDEDVAANRAMGAHGAALLADGDRVLTHCNAGALATAGHGTALGVIRSAIEAGKRIEVYADETRPFLQGARLTAWELRRDAIPVTLIADVAAGSLMARGRIQAVIVGADRVAANGDVANKIGTYMVAVLAARHAIPFYVACPLSTIDPATSTGAGIDIEERDADEVRGYGGQIWAEKDVPVANPVFDVTPASLVTALITERGVCERPTREKIGALLAEP
jgi:methylthioribose-1-phosphate isomerase